MILTIAKIALVAVLFVTLAGVILSVLLTNFQTDIFAAIDAAAPYLAALEAYLPIDTLLAAVSLVLVFEGMILIFKLAKWALS